MTQKTPLKNQTEELAVQLLENLDGHWKFHERKIIIANFLVEVLSAERKSQEQQIQQLKKEIHNLKIDKDILDSILQNNADEFFKLEKQIETAKQIPRYQICNLTGFVVICSKGIEYCKECGKVKIDVTKLFGETET